MPQIDDPDATWPDGLGPPVAVPAAPSTLPAPPPVHVDDVPTHPGTPHAVRRQSERSMRAVVIGAVIGASDGSTEGDPDTEDRDDGGTA